MLKWEKNDNKTKKKKKEREVGKMMEIIRNFNENF